MTGEAESCYTGLVFKDDLICILSFDHLSIINNNSAFSLMKVLSIYSLTIYSQNKYMIMISKMTKCTVTLSKKNMKPITVAKNDL